MSIMDPIDYYSNLKKRYCLYWYSNIVHTKVHNIILSLAQVKILSHFLVKIIVFTQTTTARILVSTRYLLPSLFITSDR